ncbi:hypothetical protein BDR07DRAFT_268967 [Suillus spraguei]|nr:hypothetical protein BDR07DRAFT_268967 [Suillus spraguei]
MILTSLATVIISATAVAGVVLADSGPPKLPCSPVGSSGCWSGETYNNGNDFVYFCGSDGYMGSWIPCSCKNCCFFVDVGNDNYVPNCTS